MTKLSIVYRDFDDYMTRASTSSIRRKLRRKFRSRRRRPIEMSILGDVTPIIDELYPLYVDVYERSALHFERLTTRRPCRPTIAPAVPRADDEGFDPPASSTFGPDATGSVLAS